MTYMLGAEKQYFAFGLNNYRMEASCRERKKGSGRISKQDNVMYANNGPPGEEKRQDRRDVTSSSHKHGGNDLQIYSAGRHFMCTVGGVLPRLARRFLLLWQEGTVGLCLEGQ